MIYDRFRVCDRFRVYHFFRPFDNKGYNHYLPPFDKLGSIHHEIFSGPRFQISLWLRTMRGVRHVSIMNRSGKSLKT